jgi:hemoglobin
MKRPTTVSCYLREAAGAAVFLMAAVVQSDRDAVSSALRSMTGRPDLSTRSDVERLVDEFYVRIRADVLLGPIFEDVARVDWDAHLPKMYDFWETMLFGRAGFKGNPLAVHRELARQVSLTTTEFNRWLELFYASVDDLFAGPSADGAKLRASRIAAVMQYHISIDEAGASSSN